MRHKLELAVGLSAAAAVLAFAQASQAGCVDPRAPRSAAAMIPGYLAAGMQPKISAPPSGPPTASNNIVGTWLVTYTSGGNPFAQALIQWHNDGTEWENINLPVEAGNVCLGSWKQVDLQDVVRFHMGWLYTSGVLTGYFTETEKDKVTSWNNYSGVNETTIYDLTGKVQAQVPGTSSAVRIGP